MPAATGLGESQGIIAFKLSRFGRGALETLQAVERIKTAGGRLPLERNGRKSVSWSRTGVSALIRSRVYRGELWDRDELMCTNAHTAIVSENQWRFAQRGGGDATHVKDGSIAAQGLLTPIVYCAGCGNKLSLTGSTNRQGERAASYFCRIHRATSGDGSVRRLPQPAPSTRMSQVNSFRRSPTRTRI